LRICKFSLKSYISFIICYQAESEESFFFLHNGYVGMVRSTRGTTEKVAHLKIHYQTAVDDPEVRSTDISPVSKLMRYA